MHLSDQSSVKNRSSLIFVIGLFCAAAFAVSFDGAARLLLLGKSTNFDPELVAAVQPIGPVGLSESDGLAAKIAWRYFAQNTRVETGLVDSVAGSPSGTLWDQGSYLLALSSARALDLVGDPEFRQRTDQFLGSLGSLPLFEGKLPNKVYELCPKVGDGCHQAAI